MVKTYPIDTPFGDIYYIGADCTATGKPHKKIEKYIKDNVMPYYSNTHSNAYNGKFMANLIQQSKDIIRSSTNMKPCDKLIFTGNGCSGAITHLIHCLKLREEKDVKPVVFISVAEHHSNHLPWTHLPVELVIISFTEDGILNLSEYEEKLIQYSDRPKYSSFIACSNVTGIVQPVKEIAKLAHSYNSYIFFDYATGAPYLPIDMHIDEESYFDAVFISTHKFLGGVNTAGILIANENLFENDEPFCPGGGTVRFVCKSMKKYIPDKEISETGGTPNILGCIKAGLCFRLKDELQEYISEREKSVNQHVGTYLRKIKNIRVINPITSHEQIPIWCFQIDYIHYNLIVVILNDFFGIQSRGGVSCCSLFAQYLLDIDKDRQKEIYSGIKNQQGMPCDYGWCRITFHYTMEDFVIDYILAAVDFISENCYLIKDFYTYEPEKNNWFFADWKPSFPMLGDKTEVKGISLTEELLEKQFDKAIKIVETMKKIL